MDTFWAGLIQQLITTAAGASFIGLSTILGFYIKRLTDNLKRKSLVTEIDNYVRWADQYPSFKKYSGEEKFNAVFARGIQWSMENGITVSPEEMTILVESTVQKMNSGRPDLEVGEVENVQPLEEQECSEEISIHPDEERAAMLFEVSAKKSDLKELRLGVEKLDSLKVLKNDEQKPTDKLEE